MFEFYCFTFLLSFAACDGVAGTAARRDPKAQYSISQLRAHSLAEALQRRVILPMVLPSAESIQSKGFTLKGALAYVEQNWGEPGVARLKEQLDPESRKIVEGMLMPGTWYPFRVQVALYEVIDRVFGAGDLKLCWEIGKFTSEYELNTVHKLFLKLASLKIWIRSAGRMWGFYYTAGQLEVGDVGRDQGIVEITGFNPISKAFCFDFGGWLHRTIELSGRSGVRVEHDACVLDGQPACRYVGRWRGSKASQ